MIVPCLQTTEELVAAGCSRRLAVRLVAMRTRRLSVSPLVLESARPGSPLETLLLRKALLDPQAPAEVLADLLAEPEAASIANELPLAIAERDGWRIVVATEELEVEASAGESLPVERPAAGPAHPAGSPGEEEAPASDAARLRVRIFAGADTAEKVAALRQLAFAPPSDEKTAVFLQAAADEDASLRAAAAVGLRALGLAPDLAEAGRLLAEGTPAERRLALERLRDHGARADGLGRAAALAALAGALRDPRAADATPACLDALAALAPHLGPELLCRDEMLRALLEHASGAPSERLVALGRACRAVEALRPGWAAGRMLAAADGSSLAFREALLELLAGMDLPPALAPEFTRLAADALPALPCDGSAARIIGRRLLETGDAGLLLLTRTVEEADVAHQRLAIRIIDTALRARPYGLDARAAAARTALAWLRRSPKQVRIDLIETRIAADPELPAELRRDLAAALARDFRDYAQGVFAEALENLLVRLGSPAVPPLLTALREHRTSPEAAPFADALGRIGMALAADPADAEACALAQDLLRELQKIAFTRPACKSSLVRALARIGAQPGMPPQVPALIVRTLLQRLQSEPDDPALLESLGLLCQSPALDAAEIQSIAALVTRPLQDAPPEPEVRVGVEDGEEVFRFGDAAGIYSDLLPACISAAEHILLAPHLAPDLRESLLTLLLTCWERNHRMEMLWGPANVTRLTEALGRIGAAGVTPAPKRLLLAQALASRGAENAALEALCTILIRGDADPELDRLAGAMSLRLLRAVEETDRSAEDREIHLRLLGRLALRGRFECRGLAPERLLERIVDALLKGMRGGVTGVLQRLLPLREARILPPALQARLEAEVGDFTGLKRLA